MYMLYSLLQQYFLFFFPIGKKSHDPREYDPLTQADSDESEDDLVINIQHNGLQNGKGTQHTTNELDSDVERISKRVQQRKIDHKQEGLAATGGQEPQLKATSSLVSYVRTTVFILTVVISMIMVLVCAFLIPCPLPSQQHVWYLNVGYEPGKQTSRNKYCMLFFFL